jgi:hypothetical protein
VTNPPCNCRIGRKICAGVGSILCRYLELRCYTTIGVVHSCGGGTWQRSISSTVLVMGSHSQRGLSRGRIQLCCCLLVNIETKLKHEGVLYREVLEGSATLRASLLLGKASGHRFSNVYTTYCVHESPMTRFFKPLSRWQYHRRFAVRLLKKKAGWYLSIK